MCAQRRLRSAWTSAQFDQTLRSPHEEALGSWLPIERKPRLYSDWVDAQADPTLHWAHMPFYYVFSCGGSFVCFSGTTNSCEFSLSPFLFNFIVYWNLHHSGISMKAFVSFDESVLSKICIEIAFLSVFQKLSPRPYWFVRQNSSVGTIYSFLHQVCCLLRIWCFMYAEI